MVDLMTGLQTFKIAFDTLNTLSQIRSDTDRTMAIAKAVSELSEARGAFMILQEEKLALTEEKRALEAECLRLKEWAIVERERYQLKKIGNDGALAYAPKAGHEADEPPHYLCPNCFSNFKKSILQGERRVGGAKAWRCHACGLDVFEHGFSNSKAR